MAKTTTGTTTLPVGIINYGSTDESVLFSDPLTSTPSNGGAIGTGVTFSSAGMDTNETGAWYFDLSALGYSSLDNAGQFSLEVKSTAISQLASQGSYNNTGSSGTALDTANDYLISWGGVNGTGGDEGRISIASDKGIYITLNASGLTNNDASLFNTPFRLSNHGREGDYTKITFSWAGSQVSLYVDDAPFASWDTGAPPTADSFKYIFIGTQENRSSAGVLLSSGQPIKNFIISKRPVMLAGHPMLRNVCIMGDSLGVAFSEAVATTTRYDYSPSYQMKAYLASKGLRCGTTPYTYPDTLNNDAVNGTFIDNTASGTAISDQAATVLARKPSIIYVSGGTNDANRTSGFTSSGFETAYKSLLTTLLTDTNAPDKVFIGTVHSLKGSDDYQTAPDTLDSQTDAVNSVINGLPAWWDTNNPSDTGRVVVAGIFTALGGHEAPNRNFIGTWNSNHPNYLNDLHPSSAGGRLMGREIGRKIFENLN